MREIRFTPTCSYKWGCVLKLRESHPNGTEIAVMFQCEQQHEP
ncbi:hypothetical protein Mal52_43890 [Symmachiella dynata]|uniref:Uncharacterized protein n=1 Tax=Symmachiella dynata TaxID=2527995 RepID=A0A517ZTT9_9PLAN|nr:hypothetical protein Mal52_43890 [Symmachiella dynata]